MKIKWSANSTCAQNITVVIISKLIDKVEKEGIVNEGKMYQKKKRFIEKDNIECNSEKRKKNKNKYQQVHKQRK